MPSLADLDDGILITMLRSSSAVTGIAVLVSLHLLLAAADAAHAATIHTGDVVVYSRIPHPMIPGIATPGIVAIDPVTGAQTEISRGSISSGGLFNSPSGLRVSSTGQVFVADTGVNAGSGASIIRVDPTTGLQSYVSTGGLLQTPRDLVIETSGALLVLDSANGLIRVDPDTGAQSLVTDNFVTPCSVGLAADGNTAYVSFTGSVVFCTGTVTEVDLLMGTSDVYSLTPTSSGTSGIVLDPSGLLYLANHASPTGVWSVDPTDESSALVAATPSRGLAQEADGDLLVTDQQGDRVLRIDPQTGDVSLLSEGGLLQPSFGIAVAPTIVPEPATGLLLGLGLAGLVARRR